MLVQLERKKGLAEREQYLDYSQELYLLIVEMSSSSTAVGLVK